MKSRPAKPSVQPPRRGKKSWREKLADSKDLPKVIEIGRDRTDRWGQGTCAIPAPRDVDALMRRVPRGQLTTVDELRQAIARQHGATIGCPITTGIFCWIAAYAADEASAAGESTITPYWRTLKTKGELNPKYPGGISGVTARLEAEGHAVVQKGKRHFVVGFERCLARLLNRDSATRRGRCGTRQNQSRRHRRSETRADAPGGKWSTATRMGIERGEVGRFA